jgi:hypothetical protein
MHMALLMEELSFLLLLLSIVESLGLVVGEPASITPEKKPYASTNAVTSQCAVHARERPLLLHRTATASH